jgi:hypothetical protein
MFFQWLEERYGGALPMQQDYINQVITSQNELRYDDLLSLFRHDVTVLKVSNYYPKSSAMQLGNELAKQARSHESKPRQRHRHQSDHEELQGLKNWKVSTSKGLESSDVFTLGAHLPYNIAFNNPESIVEEYYDKVPIEFRQRRRRRRSHGADDDDTSSTMTADLIWPLDQLRLELDEVWKDGGAGLVHTDEGYCRGGGLPRIMIGPTRWKKGFVHVDEMAPLSEKDGLFSANIYLQLPYSNDDDGGEDNRHNVLEIWPLNIRNRWDWYRVSCLKNESLTKTQEFRNSCL